MNLTCFSCKKKYIPTQSNVQIIGPDMETTCPFCFSVWRGKINKYSGMQVGPHRVLSADYAQKMMRIAEFIELETSEYYRQKGMRHGEKKKIRDIRD